MYVKSCLLLDVARTVAKTTTKQIKATKQPQQRHPHRNTASLSHVLSEVRHGDLYRCVENRFPRLITPRTECCIVLLDDKL